MKRFSLSCSLKVFAAVLGMLLACGQSFAEGSVNLIAKPGSRPHLDGAYPQQFKAWVNAGEYINVGASNLGGQGGHIKIYDPAGALVIEFNDATAAANGGEALIQNYAEEKGGPKGQPNGYNPGVLQVAPGQEGIWTIVFSSDYSGTGFNVMTNDYEWDNVADQTFSRGIIAWDVTITKNQSGNNGGAFQKGRVYFNELDIFTHEIDHPNSPEFYILTREGYQYKLAFFNIDPINFRLFSNSTGLVKGDLSPIYRSTLEADFSIVDNLTGLDPNQLYLYNPQRQDNGLVVNNKIFFSTPAADLPANAPVTDVFSTPANSHTTWLLTTPQPLSVNIGDFKLTGLNPNGTVPCDPNTLVFQGGATLDFTSTLAGTAQLCLDLNNNGSYTDPVDRAIYASVIQGQNSISWDGKDGAGNFLPLGTAYHVPYKLVIRVGETHVLFIDVENSGGFTLALQNGGALPDPNGFYYDHSAVGGEVSGGGTPGNPQLTTTAFAYDTLFGDKKLLDNWKYYAAAPNEGVLTIDVKTDCTGGGNPGLDHDNDGISDADDIDDDNDGVPDAWEYCNPNGTFTCLPNGVDPTQDLDKDGVPNYLDTNDAAYPNACPDANGDGTCDSLLPIFDTDGDGVPDHLDLDSDNDGMTDLFESNCQQPDADGNGVIDGPPSAFGFNGLYDAIDSDPTSLSATATYVRWDFDGDGIPDHDDLDSDNDGINDVIEAGFTDPDGDGQVATAGTIMVDANGLPADHTNTPTNTDGDANPDFHDLDSDGEGLLDVTEGGLPDPDHDGIVGTGVPTVNDHGQPNGAHSHPLDIDNNGVYDFQEVGCGPATTPVLSAVAGGGEICEGDVTPVSLKFSNTNAALTGNLTATVTGPGGFIYTQSFDAQQPMSIGLNGLTVANSGTFTITLSAAGCVSNAQTVNITVHPTPPGGTISVGNAVICPGGIAVFTASPNLPGVKYEWYFNNGGSNVVLQVTTSNILVINNFSAANAGNYFVELQIGTCESGVSAPATVSLATSPGAITIASSGGNNFCQGDATTLSVNVPGATAYAWTGPNGFTANTATVNLTNIQPNQAGAYQVGVTVGGCTWPADNSLTINVSSKPAAVNAGNGGAVCEGENAVLQVLPPLPSGNVIYTWFNAAGQQIGQNFTPNFTLNNVTAAQAGNYTVAVTANGCTSDKSAPTNLVVNAKPAAVNAGNGGAACVGSDAHLLVLPPLPSGNVTYTWFNAAGQQVGQTSSTDLTLTGVTAAQSGNYTVQVTANGCASDKSAPTNLTVDTPPNELATVAASNLFSCGMTDVVLVSATTPTQSVGHWTLLSGSAVITNPTNDTTFVGNIASDLVEVKWSLSFGSCPDFSSAVVKINRQASIAAANDEFSIKSGTTLTGGDITGNDALPNASGFTMTITTNPAHGTATISNGKLDYSPNANFFGIDQLVYRICSNDCPTLCADATVKITIEDDRDLLPNVITPNGDGSNDALIFPQIDKYPLNKLCVFNRWGDSVFEKEDYQNDWGGTYQDKDLPAGTYFYILFKDKNDSKSGLTSYLTIVRK